MRNWIEGFQNSIDMIEDNLDGEPDMEAIASEAAMSPFYYRRIFGALCGMSVGEYIRARRMTLAGQELSCTDMKILDAALKYGYDSPDSFTKAFQKFHGILPSEAREPGAPLRALAPLHLKISMEGGNMLEYRITEHEAFTVAGIHRRFHAETSYQEIPLFWDEWLASGHRLEGMFGICVEESDQTSDYWIAERYDPDRPLPAGWETLEIPAGLRAEFTCRGTLPESLQKLNTAIWSEWLPSLKGYTLAGNYSIEVYGPKTEDPDSYECGIWIPLNKE